MSWSPWPQGDTFDPWTFDLEPDSGTFSIAGLSPPNFTLHMRNISNGVETQGSGTFTNLVAASGVNPAMITYNQSTADVANLGNFEVWLILTSGGKTQTFSLGLLAIEPN